MISNLLWVVSIYCGANIAAYLISLIHYDCVANALQREVLVHILCCMIAIVGAAFWAALDGGEL